MNYKDGYFDVLMKDIAKDTNTLPVCVAAHIFIDVVKMIKGKSAAFKPAREKLTEEEISNIAMCLINSFLTSIYVASSNNEEQFNERMSAVENTIKELNERGADA